MLPTVDRYLQLPRGLLFEHYPVGVVEFIESPEYMDAADEIWPSIKERLKLLFNCNPYNIRLSTAREFIFEAGIGSGKDSDPETPVLMFDGQIKKYGDVKQGDLLMGDDSKPRRVKEVHRVYDQAYEITPVKGEKWIVKHDHILSLKRTNRGGTKKSNGKVYPCRKDGEIINIGLDEYLNKSKKFQNLHKLYRVGVEFPAKEVPLAPYILGVWLGDGESNNFKICNIDKGVVDEFKAFGEKSGYEVSVYKDKRGRAANYSLVKHESGKPSKTLLEDVGVLNNKHVPLIYKANSKEIRREILAGLIDTDGHVQNNYVDFSSSREVLANDVAYLARSLGYSAYVKKRKTTCQTGMFESYRVSISGMGSEMPFRKTKLSDRKQKKNVLVTGIKSVVSVGKKNLCGFTVDGNHLFLNGDFTVAHNSYLISLLFSYVIYRLMCLRDAQRTFGLARGSKIAIVNMSKNATQAKKVVFGELSARIKNSPWFQKYGLPDPNIQSELRFPKDILVIPGNSEETFPLGFNMFACNLDEAAFFTTGKEGSRHDVAEEIYYTLNRRIFGRFAGYGLLGVTSSPRYEEDFIERKVEEAQRDGAEHIMVSVLETWNSRPDDVAAIKNGQFFELKHPKKNLICKIPNRYEYDFKINPEKAWRDFGSVPSMVLEPYFKQFDLVRKSVDTMVQNGMLPHGVLREDFRPKPGATYFIHIDLALVSDACGVAMAHKEANSDVIVDLIHRITGSHKKEIDISEVKALVLNIRARGFYIGKVTYDNFQCCLVGTKISCLDGTEKEIQTFKGGEYVYSILKNGAIGYGKVNRAWCSGIKPIWRVTLDNGKHVDCTGNHPFMMRDGSYVEAQNLKEGDSLMPLYRKYKNVGSATNLYEQMYQPEGKWCWTHRIIKSQDEVVEFGNTIHHVDENERNNNPDNLKILKTQGEHLLHHSWHKEGHREFISRTISERNKVFKARLGTNTSDEARNVFKNNMNRRWENPEYRKQMSEKHTGHAGYWLGKKRSQATKDKISESKRNHKVVNTENLGVFGETWDIEIDGVHNFALSSGVFVHNSAQSIQDIRKQGIESDVFSVDKNLDAYETLKESAYGGKLKMPYHEVLLHELQRLELIEGKKVDHPIRGGKDVADAVAGAVYNAVQSGGSKQVKMSIVG
jgi:intein/homing endonuclease